MITISDECLAVIELQKSKDSLNQLLLGLSAEAIAFQEDFLKKLKEISMKQNLIMEKMIAIDESTDKILKGK